MEANYLHVSEALRASRVERRVTSAELLVWSLVVAAAVAWRVQPGLQPLMANDSFQYIGTAESFRHGLPGYTPLIYFDEERAHGAMPAPLTTFPLGYSALIAGAMSLGLSGEHAALLLSAAAVVACLWLLAFLARRLGLSPWTSRAAMLLVASNYWVLTYGSSALTESVFTALVLAGVACAIVAMQASESGRRWSGAAVGAGLCVGAAYWVRHAGLFVCLALPACAALVWRRRAFRPMLAASGVAGVAVALAIARNLLLTGGWRGGNNKFVPHAWGEIARQLVDAMSDLALGPPNEGVLAAGRPLLRALLAVAVVATVAVVYLRPAVQRALRQRLGPEIGLIALLVGVYVAAVTYAATRTMITFGTRFFAPMLPLMAIVAASAVAAVGAALSPGRWRAGWSALWAAVVVLSAVVHVDLFWTSPVSPTRERMERRLAAPLDRDGHDAYHYVRSLTQDGDVIVANMGQATGYLLHRPTVALTDPAYTDVTWTEDEVRRLCARYSARLLIVHKPREGETGDGIVSPFVADLASTSAPPPWLSVVVDAPTIRIYRPSAGSDIVH